MYLEMWSMTRTSTQELIRVKTVWQRLLWGLAPLLLAINMKMLLGWRGGSFPGVTSVLVYCVGPDWGQTWMGRVKTHTFYFFAISGFHFFPCYFDSILPSLSVSSLPSPFSIYFRSWYKIFFCKHESGHTDSLSPISPSRVHWIHSQIPDIALRDYHSVARVYPPSPISCHLPTKDKSAILPWPLNLRIHQILKSSGFVRPTISEMHFSRRTGIKLYKQINAETFMFVQ